MKRSKEEGVDEIDKLGPEILPAYLDFDAALSLQELLFSVLECQKEVDGSQVVQVSKSCLQVLLAAQKSGEKSGIPLRILNSSEVLEKCLGH